MIEKIKIPKTLFLFLLFPFFFSSCYYNVEELLYPDVDCQILDMSFVNDIVPIIEKDCYACHSKEANFANITLEGHDMISIYIDNGKLMGSINHAAGFSPMPQGAAKLLDCEIEKIASWINAGALNN